MEGGGTLNMTRSYFRDCSGVILVFNGNVMGSLHTLGEWITAAHNHSYHGNQLVFSLWMVDGEHIQHTEASLVRDFLKEWCIPDDLSINVSLTSGSGTMEGLKLMVSAVVASRNSNPLHSLNSSLLTRPPTATVSRCCS